MNHKEYKKISKDALFYYCFAYVTINVLSSQNIFQNGNPKLRWPPNAGIL